MKYNFEKFCKDYKKIENYEKAKKDDFKGWNCHHRLQTWTSDGERRLVYITADELKALDMYYNRPASELIFLTISEHCKLHNEGEHNSMYGKHLSEGHKNKIGEANKGRTVSEETREKIGAAHKGKHHSSETKNKISETKKGKQAGEKHPMYGKHHTDEARRKMSEKAKGNTHVRGTHWYNNGKINIMSKECPDGFIPGRIKKL